MAHLQKLFLFVMISPLASVAMDEPPKTGVPPFEQTEQSGANNPRFHFKTDGASVKQTGVNINGAEDTNVYNIHHAILMGNHLRSRGDTADSARKFAEEEGQCQAQQRVAFQKAAAEFDASPEGKKLKLDAIKATLELEKDIKAFELKEALSEQGQKRMHQEVEFAVRKNDLIQQQAAARAGSKESLEAKTKMMEAQQQLQTKERELVLQHTNSPEGKKLAEQEADALAYKQQLTAQKMSDLAASDGALANQAKIASAKIKAEYQEKRARLDAAKNPEHQNLENDIIDEHIRKETQALQKDFDLSQKPEFKALRDKITDAKLEKEEIERRKRIEREETPAGRELNQKEISHAVDKQHMVNEERLKRVHVVQTRQLAVETAITQAAAAIAQNRYLKENDPDLTRWGRFKNKVEEILIIAAAQATVKGVILGAELTKNQLYELYKKLPIEHARRLKKQDDATIQMIEEFEEMKKAKAQFETEKIAKEKIANLLNLETQTITATWQNIKEVKTMADQEADPEIKKWLIQRYFILRKQWVNSLMTTSEVVALNSQNQPHAIPLIREKLEQMERTKRAQVAQQNQAVTA